MARRWIPLLWSALIVSLCIDNRWTIAVGDYDLRASYFLAVLLSLSILATSRDEAWGAFRQWGRTSAMRALGVMAFAGLIGIALSPVAHRAMFFWVWTIGTFTATPWLARASVPRWGAWIARNVSVWLAIQSLVILFDAVACQETQGNFSLGRVMLYGTAWDPRHPLLCRPHAFYQEPGYFCAFALLAITGIRAELSGTRGRWRGWMIGSIVLACGAILLTTSRMGWLGLVVLGVFESIQWVRTSRKKRLKVSRPVWIGIGIAAVLFIALMGARWNALVIQIGKGVTDPTRDSSYIYRYGRLALAWKVFRSQPLFGAGPGSAGAVALDRFPDDEWLATVPPASRGVLRHDPLSQNLYTELLSEWGLIGTLGFAFFLGFLLKPTAPWTRWRVLALLGVIYLSTQTLARFDLWVMLSWISSRKNVST